MQGDFEKKLREMNEAVKTGNDSDATPNEKELALIEEMAELTQTSENTQAGVLEIQRDKAEIVKKLKRNLEALDKPDQEIEYSANGRTVGFDEGENQLFAYGKGGSKEPITLGEMMTGGEWGQTFKPNQTVPRKIVKEYLIKEARRGVLALADKQIALTSKKGSLKTAYSEVLRDSEREIGELRAGILAEKMVYTLMSRLSYDADLPFEIKQVDAYADVQEKIDFIVHIKSSAQGVRVAREGEVLNEGDVGIQFTTRTDEEGLAKKDNQVNRSMKELERVKRIVLVSVPLGRVRDVVNEWIDNNKKRKVTGGPDKLLDVQTQEKIFRGVLNGLFASEDIEAMWQKVRQF